MRDRSSPSAGSPSGALLRVKVRRGFLSCLLAFGLLSVNLGPTAQPLGAQEPRIGTRVDTAVVSVGDRLTLTVTVDHPAQSLVAWPDSLDLAPFEVLEARAIPPSTQRERTRSSLILTLAAFELGELEVPSFEVEVTEPDGEITTLTTSRFGIQVLTVGLDEDGDIRDIKGPMGIPLNLLPIFLLLLFVALAGGLARALYLRFRRGDPELRDTGPASPWRQPHEIALEALDRIESSALLENGEIKEYHIRVSEVLRSYVEGRFQVPAMEMTTLDILPGLEKTGVDATILQGFETFLDQCDLVKFAKYRPEPTTARAVLELGRRLVEDTIPSPERTAPEPAGAKEPEIQEASA